MVEWVERNCLGWQLPQDEDMMPLYRQIALYYPVEHAYTFDAYRYHMTEPEKKAMKNYYALRWWERDGGVPGRAHSGCHWLWSLIRIDSSPSYFHETSFPKCSSMSCMQGMLAFEGPTLESLGESLITPTSIIGTVCSESDDSTMTSSTALRIFASYYHLIDHKTHRETCVNLHFGMDLELEMACLRYP